MTRNLDDEIRAWLEAHGPATAPDIAVGIRARRDEVDARLADGFQEAPTPEGGNPRARYWCAPAVSSRAVPRARAGTGRSYLLQAALADGRKHSRDEIFRHAGRFFLTNNAAAELRARNVDVQHGREDGLDVYWIASLDDVASRPAGDSEPVDGAPVIGAASSSETSAVGHSAVSSAAPCPGELERADASSTLIPSQIVLDVAA